MTKQDAIAHWREGARSAFRSAELLFEGKQYQYALFLCSLSVEKALKAVWVDAHGTEEPPRTHDLLKLAMVLGRDWSDEQLLQLETLTRFVLDARYAGSRWVDEYGNEEGAAKWIEVTRSFLSLLAS